MAQNSPTVRSPLTGEKLVMGFSDSQDPIFRPTEDAHGLHVKPELGRIMTLSGIPENLQFEFDLEAVEEVCYAPSDRNPAEDQFMVRRTGELLAVYDFPFADEEAEITVTVGAMLGGPGMDAFLSVLYGNPAILGTAVPERATVN